MKKNVFILLGMFIMATTVEANTNKLSTSKVDIKHYNNTVVSFMERGIKFHIFLNGDFDFNLSERDSYYDYNGRRTMKRGIRIERDYDGAIRRVGNVFINYDRRGNVKRIGTVFMKYNRGNLTKVGGLKIIYSRWGDPRFYGRVKNLYNPGIDFNVSFGDAYNYDDAYFYRNDFNNNYYKIKEDRNFYYYKARRNAKIGKRGSILKRRKAVKKVQKKINSKRPYSFKKKRTGKRR